MKQYLIPIVTILVLILGIIVGCSKNPEQADELSSGDALASEVIEKDVEIKYQPREIDWLPFYLEVGDKVEGEVSLNEGTYHFVISEVRDPYGNVVVQTSGINRYGQYFENSGFPWRFAFIANTDGEYELGVFSSHQGGLQSARLKITIYEGD